MSLNKSKGNMYEFITHTWNAIKGACPHDCSYCYMKRWGKQKPVRFDAKELKTDLGNGNFIFVGSSCDMFAEEIPTDWIIPVLQYCNLFNNTYLFQSKNPKRILELEKELPDNAVVCTTIETDQFCLIQEYSGGQSAHDRAMAMGKLADIGIKTFVTIEPIMKFDRSYLIALIKTCKPKQINIGADSGNHNLPEPTRAEVDELIERLKESTIVHNKRNLGRLI